MLRALALLEDSVQQEGSKMGRKNKARESILSSLYEKHHFLLREYIVLWHFVRFY